MIGSRVVGMDDPHRAVVSENEAKMSRADELMFQAGGLRTRR